MLKFIEKVRSEVENFGKVKLEQVMRKENKATNALSKLRPPPQSQGI